MMKPKLDARDVLALLGVGILAYSAGMIYAPAGGLVVGAYLLAVATKG